MGSFQVFSTASVPALRATDAWQAYMSCVYYELDIIPSGTAPVHGELQRVELQSVGVSRFSASSQRVVRRRSAASIDVHENFVFLFPTRQAMEYEQHGKTGFVLPGDVVMLNSSEGYVVNVPDDSQNITFKIPCELLRPRVKGIDALCARQRPASSQFVPILSQLGSTLLTLNSTNASLLLQDAVLDLLGVMTESGDNKTPSAGVESSGMLHVFYESVMGYIARRFREPLTPESVALAHRVSVRYLHKAFSAHQTTFGRNLMEVRLLEAQRLLSQPPAQGLRRMPQIAQIAYACGFATAAHFSARYRDRFGITPRECMAAPRSRSLATAK